MPTQIYVNLPVKDLGTSEKFFGGLGFSFDPRFADENMLCMVVEDGIYVMLLTEAYFATFTGKDIADATKTTESIIALGVESRQRVDELVDKALQAGCTPSKEPLDLGFVYTRGFHDLDGHTWEATFLDPSALAG
ncbi:VOC family protein [Microbispora sp. NPDC049125]|uniref:VOC family protein n=1 Tax=Microbispora sp. NPDC049125 TaxID=3154929 RepID=UPI003466FE78